MEGRYLYAGTDSFDEDMRRTLKGEKAGIRICSLSRDPANELMWSHYADGHKGVVIGIDPNHCNCERRPIIYDGIHIFTRPSLPKMSAIEILSHKLTVWEYEKEERLFIRSGNYVNVVVKELILGRRMRKNDISFLKDLLKHLNPQIVLRHAGDIFAQKSS